jgi:uncharacterized OB-fold protein
VTRFDLPAPDPSTKDWWAAAKDGRLLVTRCRACTRAHHYPRPFCPHCWSEDVEWEAASGRGTVYTFSTVRVNDLPPFGDKVPYTVAIVELDEGPRLMTNLVDCEPEDVRIGMPVEVTFREQAGAGEFTLAMFRPVPSGS